MIFISEIIGLRPNEMPKSAMPQAIRLRYLQLLTESLGFSKDIVSMALAKEVWNI